MAEFPYTPKPSSLRGFLDAIRATGRPARVTLKYIKSLGFTSSNDRPISSILKSLGFTDSSGVPTERWQAYRDKKQGPFELAAALRETYSHLFAMYPDAYRKDDEALRNYFTSNTTVGEGAVSLMVRTFKALCELADFTSTPPTSAPAAPVSKPQATTAVAVPKLPDTTTAPQGITVNVNIQLTLPETKESSIYDSIFESLRKHLLS